MKNIEMMSILFTLRTLSLLVVFSLLTACGGGGGGAAPATQAGPIALPRTGQTSCFDTSVPPQAVACNTAGIPPGQDGAYQTGVAEPNPRFVAGTGATADCVTDNLTGLMWAGNANLPAGVRTWQQALAFANDLDLCGFTDWRLPNRKELRSLTNYGFVNNAAALNILGFNSVQAADYWSSTSYAGGAFPYAWMVRVNGGVGFDNKSSSFYVWPVRAGR